MSRHLRKEFERIIMSRDGHKIFKLSFELKNYFRAKIRAGIPVKEATMLKYMQRTGYRPDEEGFTKSEMLDAIKFAINVNIHSKKMGASFVFEQWQLKTVLKNGKR